MILKIENDEKKIQNKHINVNDTELHSILIILIHHILPLRIYLSYQNSVSHRELIYMFVEIPSLILYKIRVFYESCD